MKKVILMFIPALICGVMLTNCKRAEQKGNLAFTSDEIVASNATNEVVFADKEKDEIVSRENVDYRAFVEWVRDSIQKRASNVTNNEVVFADREKNEIVSRENVDYRAFVEWVRDSIQKRTTIVN
jgi:chaperone required for assembly of F1-ATPase